jgi:predicted AAA+ superfamily ATPase
MNLVDSLHALNKWWKVGKVNNTFLYKRIRSEFSNIVKSMGSDKILILTGPHGCGKTTLFYHTIDYLINLKTPPERIIMFSGDEPLLFGHNTGLQDVLNAYSSALLHEDIDALTAPVYIFIDEVHALKNWLQIVKRYYDRGSKLKFILSAPSRPLMLLHGIDELGSRCTEILIAPLSPQQFIEFHGVYKNSGFDNITYKSLMPRRSLFDNPREYVNSLIGNIHNLTAFRAQKMELFREYMLAGGYPSYFVCDSLTAWQNKLSGETIDLSLYCDILSNCNTKSPEKFKKLLYQIAADNGREQSYAQIGKNLSLNTVTIMNHIRLLSENGFITVCENYSGRKIGVSRKNKQIFLRDSGIKNALLRRTNITPSDLEDEIKNACVSMCEDFTEKNAGSVFFWRSNSSEADIVLDKGFTLLPISVNLKNNISKRDFRGLNAFSKTYFNRDALVITRDALSIENNVYLVPYWLI